MFELFAESDQSVIWTGSFDGSRTYSAASVSLAGIHSVNPLYNLSAKRQNIMLIANDLMAEAHDRIRRTFNVHSGFSKIL